MTQEQFLESARKGNNIFLTGKAGTGKSYILGKYVEEIGRENVMLTSSTGISALNIGGVTLHSVFRIFGLQFQKSPGYSDLDWHSKDVVIIDEISMVGPDMLDQIDKFLKHYRQSNEPFGGMQMILVGDKAQLQPVYSPNTEMDAEIIKGFEKEYGGLTFDKAHAYKSFEEIELSKVYRQNEPEFLDILNDVRVGELSALKRIQTEIPKDVWNNSVHIMPWNRMVDNHNKKAIAMLNTESKNYKGVTKGEFNLKNCITPLYLELKVGALVMITANINDKLKNGTLGTVKKFIKAGVVIEVDGMEWSIGLNKWDQKGYTKRGFETLGSFYQIPLKLAWASTIHKTQGLTLDRVIFHNVGKLSSNEIYVGLSRARSLDNLYLKNYGNAKKH